MDVIVRWLLKASKYSCVSSSMVDRCLLLAYLSRRLKGELIWYTHVPASVVVVVLIKCILYSF